MRYDIYIYIYIYIYVYVIRRLKVKLSQLCISALLSSGKQRPVTEDTNALIKLTGWPTVW